MPPPPPPPPPPPADEDLPELPPRAFAKADPARDGLFYARPRFVTHIDDRAIAAVTGLYRELFPADGVVLDLMGSWVSHLPGDVRYREVVGHGMNAAELSANPRYDRWFVQDLNLDQGLPLADNSVDAVGICVSVQYLQEPVAVLREGARVLKAGGPVAITFSNRCFPTKAVAVWQALDGRGHGALVGLYLRRAGFGRVEARELLSERGRGDPLWAVVGWKEVEQAVRSASAIPSLAMARLSLPPAYSGDRATCQPATSTAPSFPGW